MNLYQSLFTTFYNILQYYDRDKLIPIFGINGKPRGASLTSGFFPLEKRFEKNFAKTAKELNEIYERNINDVNPGDDTGITTSFFELLCISKREYKVNELNYFIAVYFIRNDIEDFDILVHSLKDLSSSPLSMILIGVGESDEDFQGIRHKLVKARSEFMKNSCFFFYCDLRKYESIEEFCYVCLNHLPTEILKFYLNTELNLPQKKKMSYNDYLRKSKISRF